MYTKFNVQFTKAQKKALQELAKELETTQSGVLKQAISLLTVAVRERKMGHQISVSRDDRVLREIIGISV